MNTLSDMQDFKIFISLVPFLSGFLLADDLHQNKKWTARKRKIQDIEKRDPTQERGKWNPQNDGEGI